jgi:Na+/proline symporter
MMQKPSIHRAVGLIFLGFGVFQIFGSTLAAMLWLLTGDWHDFLPQIVTMAFSFTVPTVYLVRKKYFGEGS